MGTTARKNKIVFFIFILAGLLIINYPFISQWVNKRNLSQVTYDYQDAIRAMSGQEREAVRQAAEAYNVELSNAVLVLTDGFSDVSESDKRYDDLLNPLGDGIMGYLEIKKIDVCIPVYHGTKEKELEKGAGHLYGSSLPVGGENTHAVLAAHRGLSSKALFTDLDQLEEGDVFYLHVMGDTLAYEVIRMDTVTPDRMDLLAIEENEDYVTLVTCTPYGINSHRLLVRGSRIPYEAKDQEDKQQASSGIWIWGRRIFACSAVIAVVAGVILLTPHRKKGGEKNGCKKKR